VTVVEPSAMTIARRSSHVIITMMAGRALRLGGQVKVRATVRVAFTETIRRLDAGWWGWISRLGARTV
jgi:hypothetical protein